MGDEATGLCSPPLFLLLLLAGPLHAQDTNVYLPDGGFAPDGAAAAMQYMVSNALAQYDEMLSTNAMGTNEMEPTGSAGTNDAADANSTTDTPPQDRSVHKESRSQWLERQRSRQANAVASAQAREGSSGGAETQRDTAPSRPDYSTFRLVNERNIFDPNRVPHQVARSRTRERTARVESFSLVGTMSYEKGTFAFFDGTSSDYKKALKLSDSIAGYKVTNITPDDVTLASSTNQVELHVGMQMRSEEGGPWTPGSQAQSYTESSASNSPVASTSNATASSSETAPSGAESDIAKRMRERREQE